MAHMDILENDAFGTRELSDAINVIPNSWGRVGELGIFMPKNLRSSKFSIESKNGVLTLVTSSERGTTLPTQKRGKRGLKHFETFRFGLSDRITAADIDGIRAFGEESELMQVEDEVVMTRKYLWNYVRKQQNWQLRRLKLINGKLKPTRKIGNLQDQCQAGLCA